MYKALYLSPMVPSFDIRGTLNFFTGLFSFKITRDEGNDVIIYKDNHVIHILNAGTDIGEMEFYLEVDDIDGLWETIKDKLDGIKVKPRYDRDYGMREFHIIIPHTRTLMFVGQVIKH